MRRIIYLSLCVFFVGVFCFSGLKIYQSMEPVGTVTPAAPAPTPIPTPTPEQKEKSSQTQNMIVPGYKSFIVNAQNRQAMVNFYNPIENDGVYDMSFEILLGNGDGTYRCLYKSECIHPGGKVETVYLNETLEAREYEDAFVVVQPYYAASGGKTMSAKMHVSISVT